MDIKVKIKSLKQLLKMKSDGSAIGFYINNTPGPWWDYDMNYLTETWITLTDWDGRTGTFRDDLHSWHISLAMCSHLGGYNRNNANSETFPGTIESNRKFPRFSKLLKSLEEFFF